MSTMTQPNNILTTATIDSLGGLVYEGYRIGSGGEQATNQFGREVGLTWQEVVDAGGRVWVDDGQPWTDYQEEL